MYFFSLLNDKLCNYIIKDNLYDAGSEFKITQSVAKPRMSAIINKYIFNDYFQAIRTLKINT